MKNQNNIFILFKTFLFVILVSFIFSNQIFYETTFIGVFAIISIFILIAEFIISLVKTQSKQVFSINTEYGEIRVSERVIENIISLVIRKYKLIKHYNCSVYNKDNILFIVLKIETTMVKSDMLPAILDTLKTNIKDGINETICITKIGEVEVIVERIKKV